MNVLPAGLRGSTLYGWRLDPDRFASSWDSGIGAERLGGRWNHVGTKAVYAAVDPATAIVEVAVHKGFHILDTEPHTLTCFELLDPDDAFIVEPDDVPNPNWLATGPSSKGQRDFGDSLLTTKPFVLIPSAVSRHSWNLIFNPDAAAGRYKLISQERFALDTRLHPLTP